MFKSVVFLALLIAGAAGVAALLLWRAVASHEDFRERQWDRPPPPPEQ